MYTAMTQMAKMLRNLDNWMVKAEAHAKTKNFDVNNFAQLRLAPDMYTFTKQVQAACDSAKFSAAYLTGKEAPKHPDTETTMTELRARVQSCLNWLETCTEEQYKGWETRKVAPAWAQGKWFTGDTYLWQAGIPNFYFHVTTAYSILRNAGVDVGKMDYMGNTPMNNPA
jgi:uncharacterized protein